MLKAIVTAGFLIIATVTAHAADLSKFAGVYRGFAPTDESAIGHGEMVEKL